MKLMIGDYEVEVKARMVNHDKMNIKDTKGFLNLLSSEMFCASLKHGEMGTEFREMDSRKMANDIYDVLDSKGYYDDIRKELA